MSVNTITLLTGLPASGKSTWAQQHLSPHVVHVSLDDIRATMGYRSGPSFSKELEEIALKTQDALILEAVAQGKNVIVDNTHLPSRIPTRIKRLFDGDVNFEVVSFRDVPVEKCIERDSLRANPVGESVIRKMSNRKYWFNLTTEWMNDVKLSPRYAPNPLKPKAIICDLDGTLFLHVARNPYDYTRVYTDEVNPRIARILRMHDAEGYDILFLSGRPEDAARSETVRALKDKVGLLPADYKLFMRPAGDNRNDADVKQDLFDKYIRNDYAVDLWLDDRDRVVRRARKLGIQVLQVADGNF